MSVHVIKPGMLTTFQDLGRIGYQHLGVPVAGAMDARAHRLANLLAGNSEDMATMEITMSGPTLRFDQPACIAICGADLSPHVRNKPIPLNRPIVLKAGSELSFGERRYGARCYLAVFGVLPWQAYWALPAPMSAVAWAAGMGARCAKVTRSD